MSVETYHPLIIPVNITLWILKLTTEVYKLGVSLGFRTHKRVESGPYGVGSPFQKDESIKEIVDPVDVGYTTS